MMHTDIDTGALAKQLLRSQGTAALAFAHARAMECVFYQDEAGEAYWLSVEHEMRTCTQRPSRRIYSA